MMLTLRTMDMMKMILEDHEKEDDIDLENHENDIVNTNSIELNFTLINIKTEDDRHITNYNHLKADINISILCFQ